MENETFLVKKKLSGNSILAKKKISSENPHFLALKIDISNQKIVLL